MGGWAKGECLTTEKLLRKFYGSAGRLLYPDYGSVYMTTQVPDCLFFKKWQDLGLSLESG